MENDLYAPLIRTLRDEFFRAEQARQLDFMKFVNRTEHAFQECGFRERLNQGVENILIMRLDVMGDFIITSGLIRELRANYPSAHITLVVSDYVYPLAELCPYVNEVLHIETRLPQSSDAFSILLKRTATFCAQNLWHRHFSMSICPQPGGFRLPSILLSYLSGAAIRIGYENNEDIGNSIFNRVLSIPDRLKHEAARAVYLLIALGLSVRSTELELWYGTEDILFVRQLLKGIASNKLQIAVGLGAGNLNRKYPIEQYAQAFRQINAHREGELILVGGDAEADDARQLQEMLPSMTVHNLVGKLNLRQTAAAAAMSDMYIGNVSGVMHAAAAAHIPVICIYREAQDKSEEALATKFPSEYYAFAPWQTLSISLRPEHALDDCKRARVYGGCVRNEAHCIAEVKPEEIVDAFDKIRFVIEKNPRGSEKYSLLNRPNGANIRRSKCIANLSF